MTTVPAAPATARAELPPVRPAQWVRTSRLLLRDALTYLVSATLVMLLVIGTLAAVGRWQGWDLALRADLQEIGAAVSAGRDGVTIVASVLLLPVAAGVAAVVVPVVLAARARVHLAAGATRRSLVVAQLLTTVAAAAYVTALTVVVLLVTGRGVDGAIAVTGAGSLGELASGLAHVACGLLLAMVLGSAVVALFLRWHWWVGTVVLVLLLLVLPAAASFVPPDLAAAAADAQDWWGGTLVLAGLVAAAYWWMMRRVPVR